MGHIDYQKFNNVLSERQDKILSEETTFLDQKVLQEVRGVLREVRSSIWTVTSLSDLRRVSDGAKDRIEAIDGLENNEHDLQRARVLLVNLISAASVALVED